MAEQVGAQGAEHALPHAREDVLLQGRGCVQARISGCGDQRGAHQAVVVFVANVVVQGHFGQIGDEQSESGGAEHAGKGQQQLPPMRFEVHQQARNHLPVEGSPAVLARAKLVQYLSGAHLRAGHANSKAHWGFSTRGLSCRR